MSGSPSAPQGRPLWQGRALALIGIVLVAFSLRSAVASLSPVLDHVAEDFPVSSVIVGLSGAAPPVCFALFGLLTPLFERRFGLERMAVVAIVLMAAGMLLRGLAPDSWSLLAATAVVFAGVGSGNVLLPPLVKKYFADRLGVMMTAYSTTLAVSTFLPPLVAVPVADSLGWRISLGMWGVVAALALVPWVTLLVRARGDDRPVPTELLVPDPPTAWTMCATQSPPRPGRSRPSRRVPASSAGSGDCRWRGRSPSCSARRRPWPTSPSPGCRPSSSTSEG